MTPLATRAFDLVDNFLERPASFVAARVRDDAERAMHVASLHNRHESGHLPFAENMVPDGALGICFFVDVHNGKPDIVEARGQFPFDRLFDVIRDSMKLLGSDNQIKVRYFIQKRRSAALRHTTEKTVHDRAIAGECAQHPHFAQGLLFGQVADAAGVQQNDVGLVLFDA